jgi:muramoyltetrapeptide carboxypeptidase
MLPLLTRSHTMSLHGMNLMDSPFSPAPGAARWWEVLGMSPGASFSQTALTHHQGAWKSYIERPDIDTYTLEQPTRWRLLGPERDVQVEGRLLGGCADVLARLVGTPFAEVERFAREHAPEGVVLYLENCEMLPADAARCWHQFALAGWFDRASAVLIGRSPAPDSDTYTQHAAIADALGGLAARGVPVLYDVDIGHQPPQMLVVNGAQARVSYTVGGRGELVQRLG